MIYDADKIGCIIGEIISISIRDYLLFSVYFFFYHKLDKTFYGTLISCLFLTYSLTSTDYTVSF